MIDPVKDKHQQGLFLDWVKAKCIGIIMAITAYGKTRIAIKAIKAVNKKYPSEVSIVIVPSTTLYRDWTNKDGHIFTNSLKDVKVFVVNSYTMQDLNRDCHLLVMDECHHYASDYAKFFSKVIELTNFKKLLGLSATLSEDEKRFFEDHNIPIVGEVTEAEGIKMGFISRSTTYNWGINATPENSEALEKIDEKFTSYFTRFHSEYSLMMACASGSTSPTPVVFNKQFMGKKLPLEWRTWWAKKMGWDGRDSHWYSPQNLQIAGIQGMRLSQKRKHIIQNEPAKIDAVEQILRHLPEYKTIVFCESAWLADQMAERVSDLSAVPYHSKIASLAIKGKHKIENPPVPDRKQLRKDGYVIIGKKKRRENIETEFKKRDSKIRIICAVRALDEGFDVPDVELIIMAGYFSTKRQNIQREGRGIRKDYKNLNKETTIINLYLNGTKEERWLKKKQKGKGGVKWITQLSEIGTTPIAKFA